MSEGVTVIVVDDHPLLRKGVVDGINKELGFTVVAEADNGDVVVDLVEKHDPTVLVTDLDLPGLSGLDVAKALRSRKNSTPIIMLTMYREESIVNEVLNSGINGYVLKEDPEQEIIRAIHDVAKGSNYLSLSVSKHMTRRKKRAREWQKEVKGLNDLTASEWKVLRLIAANQTSREIGPELNISIRTVQKHREHICEKLDLRGPNRLLEFALRYEDQIQQTAKSILAE